MTSLREQFMESFVKSMGTTSGTLAVMSMLGGVSMLVVGVARFASHFAYVSLNRHWNKESVAQKSEMTQTELELDGMSCSSSTIGPEDEDGTETIPDETVENFENTETSDSLGSLPSKAELNRFRRIFDRMM